MVHPIRSKPVVGILSAKNRRPYSQGRRPFDSRHEQRENLDASQIKDVPRFDDSRVTVDLGDGRSGRGIDGFACIVLRLKLFAVCGLEFADEDGVSGEQWNQDLPGLGEFDGVLQSAMKNLQPSKLRALIRPGLGDDERVESTVQWIAALKDGAADHEVPQVFALLCDIAAYAENRLQLLGQVSDFE
jgi:hypothetical protein